MSQQHTTQASGQGMLERVFKLREHGTTARTEVIAGFTTFLTMVYIVFVNPQILGVAGMDTSAVFVTTCLIAAFGSIMMGLFANLPVALAPAMGLNAFFAFVVVQAMGLPWQVGMGAIFWGAIGLLLLTIFRVRYWMIANIPVSLRVGITSGIGLFIGMMGLKNAGVIVANPETLVSIGNLTSHSVLLGILGFFIIAILASRNIHAAVLVSIVVTTLLGWMLGDVHYNGIVSAPPSVMSVVGHVDLAGSFNLGLAGVIFSFMLVNLFDSSGTLIGVTDKAGLADEKGKFPRMKQALYVDSISSVTGSFIGTSSVTAYIESSSGVSVGGRTGLRLKLRQVLDIGVGLLIRLFQVRHIHTALVDLHLLRQEVQAAELAVIEQAHRAIAHVALHLQRAAEVERKHVADSGRIIEICQQDPRLGLIGAVAGLEQVGLFVQLDLIGALGSLPGRIAAALDLR